ncbi:MAG: hypothetical protein ACI9LX_000010 [Paraglaciecola sp.]|jgi:hypothetical protein
MAGSYASLYTVKTPHLLYLYAAVNLNDNFVAHLTDVLVDQDSNEGLLEKRLHFHGCSLRYYSLALDLSFL